MVYLTMINAVAYVGHKTLKKTKVKKFLDTLLINVKGGTGGQGLAQFGGIGGSGGNVYLVADENMTLARLRNNTLEKQKKLLYKGGNGENSSKRMLLGPPGKSAEVQVPPGVTVTNQHGQFIGEVLQSGERLLVAKGGEGAQPANSFIGGKGHYQSITLDLKLIADIGLVGFPNAGKSSLINALSNVKAKIKPYPFTTISPQIGTMQYKDTRQISVADLPGLVEGAHHNFGMGHNFLKHMERTKMLLFVIDLHGFQFKINMPDRTAFESVLILLKEMELSKSELLSKPAVIVVNKIDLPGSDEIVEEVKHKIIHMEDYFHEVEEELRPTEKFKFDDVIAISARKGINIIDLKERLRVYLDMYNDQQKQEEFEKQSESYVDNIKSHLTEHTGSGTWV